MSQPAYCTADEISFTNSLQFAKATTVSLNSKTHERKKNQMMLQYERQFSYQQSCCHDTKTTEVFFPAFHRCWHKASESL